MDVQEALVVLDRTLKQEGLNDIQEVVFRQTWEGQTYPEIAESSGYDAGYIKDVGYRLWKLLSQALGEQVTKSNLRSVLRRQLQQTQVLTTQFAVCLDSVKEQQQSREEIENLTKSKVQHQTDWGEAADVPVFYGRNEEFAKLQHWIVEDRCRLVALLGMGGIGKTALSIKLAEQIQPQFDYLIWRSLRYAPPVQEILVNLIQFLSNQQEIEADLPQNLNGKILRLIDYLRTSRCLLILDNIETILCSGDRAGHYREGYEDYGELIRRIGEARHQSCLVLTSREKPKEFVLLEGEILPVRSLQLNGLKEVEGRKIFTAKGSFSGTENEWRIIIKHYAGNPLALKMVAAGIKEVFNSELADFLRLLEQGIFVFDDIQDLLERQFDRLSDLEKEVMYWLAIKREPISLAELQENILSSGAQQKLPATLRSLGQRSLIEKKATTFTQQPVVMDYITSRLIEQVCEEIITGKIAIFNSHALIVAQGKDYVRDSQIRFILTPVIDKLLAFSNKKVIENQLSQIISMLRQRSPREPGYAAGNILNLLCQLNIDLSGYNFSHLTVWQAHLPGRNLRQVNFAHSNLAKSVFTDDLSIILSVAFSPDGKLLATGDTDGEVRLWRVADCKKLFTCRGHTNWVWSVAFSPQGHTLASGSEDQTIRLWDTRTGECLQTLQKHTNRVWSVAFNPQGHTLASGSEDQTIRLWDVYTGECRQILQGHTNWVRSVAFSPDGKTLASGSDDYTVKIWNIRTGKYYKTLQGHTSRVWSVAFSPDGKTLASGSDHTVKLWDVFTGECRQTLQGHNNWVRSVAFSPQGHTLASGSEDQTIRLWDVYTGECRQILQGHTNWVRSVAFSPDGQTLVSGSGDHTVKLWDVTDGKCCKTLQGYTSRVWSVSFSPQGDTLASGDDERTIRLWDVSTGECRRTLQGHTNRVWSVAFNSQGNILASGSGDCTVRLWDVFTGKCRQILQGHSTGVWTVAFGSQSNILASGGNQIVRLWDIFTGECRQILQGHTNRVWSVAFSPDGQTLASCSHDQTVRLWDVFTGKCHQILQGHTNWVWTVAFGPQGNILASGSGDHTVRLWNIITGECCKILQGHTSRVWSVAFSPDGQTLASCSSDHTVKLWNVSTGKCYQTLKSHTNVTWSVAFSPDGQTIASGSQDETIKLWNVNTGECLKTLRSERPYEGMSVAGVKGLTPATIATLKALGALEQ